MSERSAEQLCLPWTSFAAGSRAKTSASQGSAPDSTALGPGCGSSTDASSKKSSRRSSSSKTCSGCGRPDCLECWPTLPISGSMRNGRILPPQTLERRTEGGVSSSLLPVASNYGSNQGGSNGRAGPMRPSLQTMAKAGMLPTPTARDWKSGAASDATMGRNSRPLNEWAHAGMLPTPTRKGNHNKAGLSPSSGDGLATAVGGRLSARFVEWMMGFPIDHTVDD